MNDDSPTTSTTIWTRTEIWGPHNPDVGYCETDSCDKTRNVDVMLERFAKDREVTIGALVNAPERFIAGLWDPQLSTLSIDRKCRCQLGTTYNASLLGLTDDLPGVISDHDDRFLRGLFQCAQCRNIGRLVQIGKRSVIDRPFTLECGKMVGVQLVIRRRDLDDKLSLRLTNEPRSLAMSLLSRHQDVFACQPKVAPGDGLKWLYVDRFTNELLITWLLDHQMEQSGLKHIVKMHTAFVCGDHGYVVYQEPDLGHVAGLQAIPDLLNRENCSLPTAKSHTHIPLQSTVIVGIIKQLVTILHFGSQFDFTHGNPSGHALFFDSHPSSYRYDNVHVMCPVTLKLGDLTLSSMTIQTADGPLRIFSRADDHRTITKFPFIPAIETITTIPWNNDRHEAQRSVSGQSSCHKSNDQRYLTYRLTAETVPIMVSARHLGVPLFGSSLDLYCFMTALMLEPTICEGVRSDIELNAFWSDLWLPEEVVVINDRIGTLAASLSHDNIKADFGSILILLSGLRLRCDITEMAWNRLKRME
jgi:serine/threonine protein kinase